MNAAVTSNKSRAYFAGSVTDFTRGDPGVIVGELLKRTNRVFSGDDRQQLIAWERQLDILRKTFETIGSRCKYWGLLLELPLHRLAKRLDAVVLIGATIAVVEFKIGATSYGSADVEQVEDYALCLRDFHSGSASRTIVPILCAEKAIQAPLPHSLGPKDWITETLRVNASHLATALCLVRSLSSEAAQLDWVAFDQASYNPTPTIVEAAKAIYDGHSVQELGRSDAAADVIENVSRILHNLTREAKAAGTRKICFVTGTPGAGKTLLGLNLVFSETEFRSDGEPAAMLSGNPPLVYVLQEALAEDSAPRHGGKKEARRRTQAAIQNLTGYLREHSAPNAPAPPEHVIVYDEAQRAWDADTGMKLLGRERSEPALFLEIMGKLPWCCLVCLTGPGQEINRGEGGLRLWGEALAEEFQAGRHWDVHASPQVLHENEDLVGQGLLDSFNGGANFVFSEQGLHLAANVRAYRNVLHTAWVQALLKDRIDVAKGLADQMPEPPAVISRDLESVRTWLTERARGGRRVGLLSSSSNTRSVGDGIPVSPRSNELDRVAHWFLKPKGDFRSSNSLEFPLSEFVCQGLEVDYAGLCWGADLIWEKGSWVPRKIIGANWREVKNEGTRLHRINAYRVLLTRARAGLAIHVPIGNAEDKTRSPAQFSSVYQTLLSAGCSPLGPPA